LFDEDDRGERYKQHEVSTGYYDEYEVLPQRRRPIISVPGVAKGIFPFTPGAAQVRIRTRLADSHRAIKFYRNLRCQTCHKDQRSQRLVRQLLGPSSQSFFEHYPQEFSSVILFVLDNDRYCRRHFFDLLTPCILVGSARAV